MRILVVSNFYPPHAYGGYELSCRDVVEHWRAAGHEVLVLTSDVRLPGLEAPDPPGVLRDLRLYWEDHVIVNPRLDRRWRTERANQRALDRALAALRPDVASVWNMGAVSMGLLSTLARRRVPTVLSICDEWPVYGPEVDAFLRPLASRPRLAAVVGAVTGLPTALPPLDDLGPALFVSGWLRDVVRARSRWAFADATVVHSGIDPADFPSAAAPRPGRFRWRLLYVGRLDPRKGVDTVVDALAHCPPEATLSVVGRGDDRYRGELAARARRLGLGDRVVFAEAPRHELARWYTAADAVVFPSRWEEPFGLVPLEAMACGTPVVAAPTGGAAEFLADGANCLTVAPGDAAAIAAGLTRLAADPELRSRLVRGGRATAARLTTGRLAQVMADAHHQAARRPGAGAGRGAPGSGPVGSAAVAR